MEIDIITAIYNNENFDKSFKSIRNQTKKVRHIIVDGKSDINVLDKLKSYVRNNDIIISEKDEGIYDAINKGIKLSKSEIVGLLHSDDSFYSNDVLEKISDAFEKNNIDVLYGDLEYVSDDNTVIRYWKSSLFRKVSLFFGWMPPHPTLFIRKSLFDEIGYYKSNYRISGDYEFCLRLFSRKGLKFYYLNEIITSMKLGGASNKSLKNIKIKMVEDIKALKENGYFPFFILFFKNLRKLPQFFIRSFNR